MRFKISLQSRKKLLALVQKRYQQASWFDKNKILDELVSTTSYCRKYVISFLNQDEAKTVVQKNNLVKKNITRLLGKPCLRYGMLLIEFVLKD